MDAPAQSRRQWRPLTCRTRELPSTCTTGGPTSTGGIIVLVADDKAGAHEILRRMREYNQANHPELATTEQPRLIEGRAGRRVRGETVTA